MNGASANQVKLAVNQCSDELSDCFWFRFWGTWKISFSQWSKGQRCSSKRWWNNVWLRFKGQILARLASALTDVHTSSHTTWTRVRLPHSHSRRLWPLKQRKTSSPGPEKPWFTSGFRSWSSDHVFQLKHKYLDIFQNVVDTIATEPTQLSLLWTLLSWAARVRTSTDGYRGLTANWFLLTGV